MSINSQTRGSVSDAKPKGGGNSMKRVVAASFVGTTLEYYDFFAYSTAASIVFPILFFPGSDPATGLLLALATYAVGYVVRPLGAAIFGHFGDKIGRKNVLVTTLLLMGLASAAVGLLPTYENIGVWAPVLLVACASCRASASAANGAAPPSWSPNRTRVAAAVSSAASCRARPPPACSWPPASSRS